MYYKLNPRYLLRGWDRLPNGLTDTSAGKTFFVSSDIMEVLKMCSGRINFDLPLIPQESRDIVSELEKRGIVSPCAAGDAIEPIQEYQKYANRYIRQAHWSITGRCNYKCRHCCLSAPDAKFGELPHETIIKMIDELGECGVFSVTLTGGEPLVRADFWEIVDALRERRIAIGTIYTNGALVSEKLLEGLRDRGLDPEFNMSFDGTEGWHDWMRGIPGAAGHVDRAFRLCREYGFLTGAEMCLHKQNMHTLRDSVNYLALVGCGVLKTNPVSDLGAWHDGGYGEAVSMKELYDAYLDYIPEYYQDGKPLSIYLGGFFHASPAHRQYTIPMLKTGCNDLDRVAVCGHARNVMYISPEGTALPCFSLSSLKEKDEYPSIPEKGLRYCLTDSSYMKLIETAVSRVIAHNERCIGCEYARYCHGGCRASAMESTPEDIFGIDEAACLIFRGGYVEKIMAAAEKADPEAVCGTRFDS